MNSSTELFSKLNEYLDRQISLSDLESWLVPRLPVLLDAPDSLCGKIAGAIELCLAEICDGLKTERGVRASLARYRDSQENPWLIPESAGSTEETSSMTSAFTDEALLTQSLVWYSEPAAASG